MTKIIKRYLEVNDTVTLWKQICRGETSITFREFYGIPGIGKTELAKQIEEALVSEGALCAHLDFDPIQNPWGNERRNLNAVSLYYDKPEKLFKDLLTKWDYINNPDLEVKLATSSENSTFEPRIFAHRVIVQVNALPSDKTVALICDETDHIQWEQLSWFEEYLIAPLIRSGRCLIIWLGRRKKQWPKELVSLKGKVKPTLLTSLSPDDIAEQLELEKLKLNKEQKDNLLDWLYDVTQGHPMSAEVAEKHLAQSISEKGGFQENPEIIEDIMERVIKGYILRNNPLEFSDVLNLSLFRNDDPLLMRAVAGNPSDSLLPYGKRSIALKANPIGGFDGSPLNKSIANWLHRYYRFSDPENYLKKQRALLEECRRQSQKISKFSWSKYVLESIYHAACANLVTTEKYDLVEMLREHLQNIQIAEYIDESESLKMELRESFLNDKEMPELIGTSVFDRLLEEL